MNLPPLRLAVCILLFTLCWINLEAAQGQENQWNVPRFSENVAMTYDAASLRSPKKPSDVLVLHDENDYKFDRDGKFVFTHYAVYKILSQKGIEGWDSISIDWEPWHQEKPTVRARVIGSDHSSHPLDPKTVSDSPAQDEDEKEYGDGRVVRAPLPAIAVGAVVEEETTVRETAPLFAAGVVRRTTFGFAAPVAETQLILDAPDSLHLQYRAQLLPQLQIDKHEDNGRTRVSFRQGTLESLENSEPYLPSEQPAFPAVTFSTAASWQNVAEAYDKIVAGRIQEGDVRELASTIVRGKTTVDEKLAAIVQYLSKEIRYTGIEFDEAGIVPHPPSETVKQKYGDCKDKSTLLAALAQAAGIPAYVALLRVGSREDVLEDLPGIGMFDHAIVYVPGSPSYWIDATDQYARLGQLPSSDQGRRALIARPGSTALVLTPESKSSENMLREYREFYLAENGPARVVEISEPTGVFEGTYRSAYGAGDDKNSRKELTEYVKNEYLAEKLTKLEHTDANDLSTQFRLNLEASSAKRGLTELADAVAAIRLESLFENLPMELRQKEATRKKVAADDTAPKERMGDYQLLEAFRVEWNYKIYSPAGFRPKPLPDKKTLELGPAVYSQQFSLDADGTVRAQITLDTTKRRITLAESKEMRNQIAQLTGQQAILVYFEPVANALMVEGKTREALESTRTLIALHPKEAVHHLQLANALLAAGMGQAAREEGRKAVALEPNSALAQKTLADILEYDLVGRKMRPGSDFPGAEKAFRTAQKLDPDDDAITANLAILLEFDPSGERYGGGARLKDAVTEYRELSSDQLGELGLRSNLAFALFYEGDLSAARTEAETLNPPLKSLIVAAEAITNGAQAGLAEARKRTSGDQEFKDIVKGSGEMAMRCRSYDVAAELMEAGASGNNSSNSMALAGMLRKARKREQLTFKDDPAGLMEKMFVDLLDGKMTEQSMEAISSKNALIVEKRKNPEERGRDLKSAKQIGQMMMRQGLPVDAMKDIIVQIMQANSEGDDDNGYKVTLRVPGRANIQTYFVKEGGQYKMLDSSEKPNSIALEILDRVQANNLAGARVLLDWIRDTQHVSGGDDAMSGFAFPRMWTKGKEAGARETRLAGAALACETPETAREGILVLEAARADVGSDAEKLNTSLALLDGYRASRDYAKLYALATELAENHGDSKRLFEDRATGLIGLKRYDEVDKLTADWQKKDANDIEPMRVGVRSAVAAENYALARERSIKIEATDRVEASDYNGRAWFSLFTGKTDSSDVEAATKAAQMSKSSPGILHTLACVYAELGKTKEARELLIQAMDLLYLEEPDDNYWYGLGRIAEQYGEVQTATEDYQAVKKPWLAESIPSSSYRLAQMRLEQLTTQRGPSAK